ncbi:lipid II flippase MurJ [Cochlodiniinecator piscidefendens]|uniref:lipid II flippase MurJ n=1 Tax=Cochlodiniinecator piscidefendens TaxID=2715756 RepID=UPI00140A296F|nr:lipid II flippase MurJ [Cochlodiniinecator piscidefendens]
MSATAILRGTSLVFILAMVGRVTGFLREVVIAYYFGTSEQADALIIGLTPIILFTGILGSAYASAAMVQIKDGTAKEQVLRTLVPVLSLSVLVSLALLAFAPSVIEIFAVGMSQDGKDFAADFTRLAAPAIIFAALAAWSTGLSHLRHRFLAPALGSLMPNIGLLVGIVVGFQLAGVSGLALVALLGYALYFLIVVNWQDYRLKGALSVGLLDSEQLRLYRNVALTIASSFVVYMDLTLDRWFAIQISEGAVAALNYASKLVQLPTYTVIFAIVTIMFPRLIQARDNPTLHKQMKQKMYLYTLVLCFFITIIIMTASELLVRLVFEYGAFDVASTEKTASFLRAYGVGFTGYAFVLVGTKVRFSEQDFLTPLYAGAAAIVIKVALDFLLIDPFGAQGLALATSGAALVNATILLAWPPRPKPLEIL